MTQEEQINNLENEIAELHCSLTYQEILKVAIFTAKKCIEAIPTYTGVINKPRMRWNLIKEELENMLKLEIESN